MKKHYLKLLVLLLVSMCTYGQNIKFTDAKFKKALVAHKNPVIDTNKDGQISIVEAKKVKRLYLRNKGIKSLKEIHFFTNLMDLDCSNNNISDLYLSKNLKLNGLNCSSNLLSDLDLSKNLKLKKFDYADNQFFYAVDISKNLQLTELDCSGNILGGGLDISKHLKLRYFTCFGNQLYYLDVSNNINLTKLDCSGNDLRELDISKNLKMKELICSSNRLSSLNISNIGLTKLDCSDNDLSSLDVSKNINLTKLDCSYNELSNIDVSNNLKLTELLCYSNNLINLKVKNAKLKKIYFEKNRELSTVYLTSQLLKKNEVRFKDCPKLKFICVDKGQVNRFKKLCKKYKYTNCNVSSSCTQNILGDEKINKPITKVKFTDYFKLYPNPTTHILNIEPIEDDIKVKFIYIYNNYGSLVAFFYGTVKQLNLDFLIPEYYHIRLETNKGLLSAPFVIKR